MSVLRRQEATNSEFPLRVAAASDCHDAGDGPLWAVFSMNRFLVYMNCLAAGRLVADV